MCQTERLSITRLSTSKCYNLLKTMFFDAYQITCHYSHCSNKCNHRKMEVLNHFCLSHQQSFLGSAGHWMRHFYLYKNYCHSVLRYHHLLFHSKSLFLSKNDIVKNTSFKKLFIDVNTKLHTKS